MPLWRVRIALAAGILLGIGSVQAAVPVVLPAFDNTRVLSLSPADLPALAGRAIADVRVATVRNGVLVTVPFQIDEYNQRDLVWFEKADLPMDGKKGVYDGRDRFLFIAGDASPEALTPAVKLPAGYIGELSFTVQGETRYLQLIIDRAYPLSDKNYVDHDLVSGVTETPFYTLRVDPENELNWRYLMVRSWRGDQAQSLVDTLKMRIAGGVFTPVTRLTLDNENLRPKVVGVRSGPIRSTLQLETHVVVGGIRVMRMQAQVVRYPYYFEAFTLARIPKLYRMALVDPEVRVTIDGNNLRGAVTRTARGAELHGTVDGRIDDAERQLIGRGLSSDDGWVLIDTRNGFSMMTFLDVPPELRGIPLKLVYEDDPAQQDKPERIPGQGPNLGYGIRGFPPGEDFQFGVTLSFDRDLNGIDPKQYVARWREKPVYRFRPPG